METGYSTIRVVGNGPAGKLAGGGEARPLRHASPASSGGPSLAKTRNRVTTGTPTALYLEGLRVTTDVDRETGRVVGVFTDKKTGQVVSKVPSESMLRLLAKTRAMLGMLFDEKV